MNHFDGALFGSILGGANNSQEFGGLTELNFCFQLVGKAVKWLSPIFR